MSKAGKPPAVGRRGKAILILAAAFRRAITAPGGVKDASFAIGNAHT